jgi:hypothetical protein
MGMETGGQMRQAILKGALLTQHREAGLKLTHPREHLLCLETGGGSPISYFDSKGVTVAEIRKTADTWMKETDACSYTEPVMEFLKMERPFYDKRLTMQDFITYLTTPKKPLTCPECGKVVKEKTTCCGQIRHYSIEVKSAKS